MPLEEIRETRRAKAKALLATGTKTEVVASLCGYSSRSSLYRLLKENQLRI